MAYLSEAAVEKMVLDRLSGLSYAIAADSEIGPDGKAPEREAYADVILVKRLVAAIERLNPSIPLEACGDALRKVLATEKPSLVEENRRLQKLMVEGVDVEFYSEDGTIRGDKVRLIDFENPDANDWLATGQFTVVEGNVNRRPDVVVFINGLPIGVIELKAPGGENATLASAFNQLQTYKTQISSLVSDECGSRHVRRHHCADRFSDGGFRTVYAVAYDRWKGHCRKRTAGASGFNRGHLRSPPFARPIARFHGFRGDGVRLGKDHCRLPPVPRRAPCGR
jgi:hypothetical protein